MARPALLQGWPQRFLERYAQRTEYHDDSMNKCSLAMDERDMNASTLSLARLVSRMSLASYSTAFSGVDSPGTAFAMLRCACAHALEDDQLVASPRHLHAIAARLQELRVGCWL